jgi:hypothetical protein
MEEETMEESFEKPGEIHRNLKGYVERALRFIWDGK